MALTAKSTTIRRNLKSSWLNVPCPECGRTTDEGMCYHNACRIGFYNIQVELGREVPEDWLMPYVDEEGATPAPSSPALTVTMPRTCPECGEEFLQGWDDCMEEDRWRGIVNLDDTRADAAYHGRW